MNQLMRESETHSEAVEPYARMPRPGGTYIMEGATRDAALDIYHLIFAPTHACNLRCKHCYLPDHTAVRLPKKVALSLVDQWGEIVLAERGRFGGIFHVKGGEPFVVPYLNDIFDRMAELQSLRLMLTTNGTFLRPEVFASLERANAALHGHVTVIVSLDGATSETHDYLRGEGQFAITQRFLRELQILGIHTFLNCVLHQDNLHEVESYIDLAKSLDVAQINFLPLVPKGFGTTLRCKQAAPLQVHKVVQQVYESGDDRTRTLLAGSLSHILDRTRLGIVPAHECVAGYRGLFYITPEGGAFTCPNLIHTSHELGNVKTESLREIMARLPNFRRGLRPNAENDAFLCTGERDLYGRTGHEIGSIGLRELQRALGPNFEVGHSRGQTGTEQAYCVSRNF